MNSVSVEDPLRDPDWDRQLSSLPGSTAFHSAAWARVLVSTYDFKPHYFVLRENNKVTACLPIMEAASWLTPRRGISLPFTDECSVLGDNIARQTLVSRVIEECTGLGWAYCEFRHSDIMSNETPARSKFFGHTLRLPRDEHTAFHKFDGSVRQAVRKATRSGVTIEFPQDIEGVKTFYRLHCKTRGRHGTPPQSFRFFEALYQLGLRPGFGCMVLARFNGIAIAAAIYLHNGSHAIYKFGASDDKYQHLRANNLVMWRAIEWHIQHGFDVLDFGRTDTQNEGLRRFKLGWGTKEYTIKYFRYDIRRRSFLEPRRGKSQWQARIFQQLPASVSRLLGRALYRHAA